MWRWLLYGTWTGWGAIWFALWLWANRTTGAAAARAQAPYRIVNIAGWGLLLWDGLVRVPLIRAGLAVVVRPLWPVPAALGWACASALVVASGFAIAARLTLGRLWSAAVTRKEGHRIVATGPYAVTRHPIYTALLLAAVATAAAKATPMALAGCLLMILGYVLKARTEEGFLSTELGATAYADYRRRVPMLVPWLR